MQFVRRVAARITREIDELRLIREREREFHDDPNNRPNLVVQGCQDRSRKDIEDSSILKRILVSYNKAKRAQNEAPTAYQISNEWLPIYNYNLREVMEALAKGHIDELAAMYRNFFRDPCSTGLVGLPVNMKKRYFSGKISKRARLLYLYDVLCRYKLWRQLLGDQYTVRNLASSPIGNPFGLELDGVFVSHGSDYLHYYATEVNRLAGDKEHPIIVELGGGYGGMAYFLIRDSAKTVYVDFDLPENLALTAYYLLNAFPAVNVVLYGEKELNTATIRDSRIVLMPNFEIERLPRNSADVVFNSYSLAEMSAEAIDEYIKHMTKISKGYFMHVNHTKNSLVKADDFGIERYGYELLHRRPALWNRGRMLVVDEFEFLYSKVAENGFGCSNADDQT
jgi:putative sugar O-methyltransferase